MLEKEGSGQGHKAPGAPHGGRTPIPNPWAEGMHLSAGSLLFEVFTQKRVWWTEPCTPRKISWSPVLQYFQTWPYLETGPLRM